MKIINDPYFRVTIDKNGSSPAPDKSIWTAQHLCVSDGFAPDAEIPGNPADAVIKHQFKPKHWSVLGFGYVVLHFGGFPHDTVMQLVRHQDSKPLVQSFRYTGEDKGCDKMRRCGNGEIDVEEMFYAPPVGEYATRSGRYTITESDRREYLSEYLSSAKAYSRALSKGHPAEVARGLLAARYRQNFAMAGTIQAVFHWLDQRTLADSQAEAQTLAWMALQQLKNWSPEFFEWYEVNRAGRNLLAP
jgi:thymidylate synthase (FAD)